MAPWLKLSKNNVSNTWLKNFGWYLHARVQSGMKLISQIMGSIVFWVWVGWWPFDRPSPAGCSWRQSSIKSIAYIARDWRLSLRPRGGLSLQAASNTWRIILKILLFEITIKKYTLRSISLASWLLFQSTIYLNVSPLEVGLLLFEHWHKLVAIDLLQVDRSIVHHGEVLLIVVQVV